MSMVRRAVALARRIAPCRRGGACRRPCRLQRDMSRFDATRSQSQAAGQRPADPARSSLSGRSVRPRRRHRRRSQALPPAALRRRPACAGSAGIGSYQPPQRATQSPARRAARAPPRRAPRRTGAGKAAPPSRSRRARRSTRCRAATACRPRDPAGERHAHRPQLQPGQRMVIPRCSISRRAAAAASAAAPPHAASRGRRRRPPAQAMPCRRARRDDLTRSRGTIS